MNNRIALVLISVLLFNGCIVSKKKYDASLLENANLTKELKVSQAQNKSLEQKLNNNIKEFEKMKNDLHLSNAVKSDEMSDLLIKVTELTDHNTKLKAELDESLTLYKSQKQSSISTADELKKLKTNNQKLKRDTANIKYALSLSEQRFKKLEEEFQIQKNKYVNLNSQNQKSTKELELNKRKLASFEQQLIGNKDKMEAISKAFIELRKEMLSAKSGNKAIDPNKNKHIDKIAKELGHY
ncbi:hypothetical protein E9993_14320 [Labilibacter sediminis]|nr:hypothetical protein E9993_14320 [Labilibacter sediminis]